MNQLEILQDQFEDAATKFESMAHLIICSDRISVLNIPDKHWPNPDNRVDDWTSGSELHYLLRLEGADWDKDTALCKYKILADKVVGWLLDNKDTLGVWDIISEAVGLGFGNPVYLWLLVVRKLRPNEAIRITGGCGDTRRAAENGEPYYSILEGVFLESAFACNKLLERLKATPAATDNGGDKVEVDEPVGKSGHSMPLSWKQWAEVFGMSRAALRKVREAENPRYHFCRTRPGARKWTLPKHELPAEYLERYRKATS